METGTVKSVAIEEEMKTSYLDYAMSVIVSRALPDVRDGLKPVQRRILYAMDELGLRHNSPYKKSARIVGEVLGKYHPHGDAPVYEAMVRMAQDFSVRYPLVNGQGNFGSIDNDPPAAMRYTEARLAEVAQEMLADIDKNTVDLAPNFDDSLKEPSVLPARLPNLLVNGSSGIAVGMATNIPPHNLGEICDALNYVIDNPQCAVDELMHFVKGPDFPTGGVILGEEGIRNACATGEGKVVVRANVTEASVRGGGRQIVVTELPYQVNKSALVERIAELVKGKRIDGIAEVRDESDREGMRLVIELKKESESRQVLNNLYKNTLMQSAFFINMVALVNGQPKVIDLKEALECYVDFRREIVTRRCQFELQKAKERAHILEGFRIALDNLERLINIIRQCETAEAARAELQATFELSSNQVQAVLDMPLRRLAHLEQEKINTEHADLLKDISYLDDVLANPEKLLSVIKQEIVELKSKYADARRTQICEEEITEFRKEDLISHRQMVVTLSSQGFIKRIPASTYRLQHRGGKGVIGMAMRESDFVSHLVVADTHDNLLFFTSRGKVYCLKCYEVPEAASRITKGTALVSLVPIDLKDQITDLSVITDFPSDMFLVMATKKGQIKKTRLNGFSSIRRNGLIAFRLGNHDELAAASVVADSDEVILVSQNAQAVRFRVRDLRTASRASGGVRGIRLSNDRIISMSTVFPDAYLLTVTQNGFGKSTPIRSYSIHKRGGRGMQAHKLNDRTGKIAAYKLVSPNGHLLMVSTFGNIVCIPMEQVPIHRRNSQGARLMSLAEGDSILSIAAVDQVV
jgi:DNA gyrase subunit A